MRYHYDREADVTYFYFDRPRKAKTIELDADFLLRLDDDAADLSRAFRQTKIALESRL